MTRRAAALAAVLIWGCAAHRPARRPLWERYADRGPLAVQDARRSDPGPAIYRALRGDPRAGRLLAGGPAPETVEVVSVRGGAHRVVLTYPAGADGRASRLVVDPSTGARVVSKADRSAAIPGTARPRAAPKRESPTPTARQTLECPVDPDRTDCRALCTGGAGYEWCR